VNATKPLLLSFLLLLLLSFPAAAQVNDTYVIPVSGNVPGAFGTRWMTQFSVFNPQPYPLTVSITFLPTGGGRGSEELIEIPGNAVAHSDNILQELFGIAGSGSLLVATFAEDNPTVPNEMIARAIVVNSSTYNNSSTGTYGQTIPGTWTGLLDLESDGVTAVAHGIRNLASEGWRTNIGAINLGRCSVRMLVSVYDYDGNTILDDAPYLIPPQGHMQDRLPIEVDRGTVEFAIVDPCAADDARYAVVFPYTSTIDQLSGDPTYQSPTLLASVGYLYGKTGRKIDAHNVGKKIDSTYARGIRAEAQRLGRAKLVRTAKGFQITR
jgi:hypothetical protein